MPPFYKARSNIMIPKIALAALFALTFAGPAAAELVLD